MIQCALTLGSKVHHNSARLFSNAQTDRRKLLFKIFKKNVTSISNTSISYIYTIHFVNVYTVNNTIFLSDLEKQYYRETFNRSWLNIVKLYNELPPKSSEDLKNTNKIHCGLCNVEDYFDKYCENYTGLTLYGQILQTFGKRCSIFELLFINAGVKRKNPLFPVPSYRQIYWWNISLLACHNDWGQIIHLGKSLS